MTAMMIYVTAADGQEAKKIGRELVEARLAACANVFESMTPIFWWDGKVQEGAEAAVIVKTSEARVRDVIAKVRELHSYDCPCVVAWPISAGNPAFLNWIEGEVAATRV